MPKVSMEADFPFDIGDIVCLDTDLAASNHPPTFCVERLRLTHWKTFDGRMVIDAEVDLAGSVYGVKQQMTVGVSRLRPSPYTKAKGTA